MDFNVLAGLPRSGSTMLQNILNENTENCYVSSTSPLCAIVSQVIETVSKSYEVKSDLAFDRMVTEAKLRNTLLSITSTWYNDETRKVFDKGRGWVNLILQLKHLYPNSRVIIMLRDLRDIVASIEMQHRKFPILDANKGTRLDQLIESCFDPKVGLIGKYLPGIKDIVDRGIEVFWLRLEDFLLYPLPTLEKLYWYLELESFEHDLENIKKTANDLDALYLNKFPHDGSGALKSYQPIWQNCMSIQAGQYIFNQAPWYNEVFGYEFGKLGKVCL